MSLKKYLGKIRTRKWFIGGSLLFVLVGLTFAGWFFLIHEGGKAPPIKTADQPVMGERGVPDEFSLGPDEDSFSFTSEPFEAEFGFNAIAPHWREEAGAEGYEEHRQMKIRTSNDNKEWTDWFEVDVEGPLRDDDPHPDEMFPETPIFVEGRYFQFSFTLERPSPGGEAATVSDMVVTYLDSRESTQQKVSRKVRDFFDPPKAYAADQVPQVITRSGWGSPDPDNTLFKDTDKEWPASYSPVKQIYIHHTVNANTSNDFAAVMRGIWQFQSYTRGWGDIGYNYLVDGNGQIYEGRFGGDNVVGGHVKGFNTGSMGIALIGCFQPNHSDCVSLNGGNAGPSGSMLNSLYNLIGWRAKTYEIDTRAVHTFCGFPPPGNQVCQNLFTVTGHRDSQDTACPGNYIYDLLPTIREASESRKLNLFPYAAKQLGYGVIETSNGQHGITLQFKNTGSTTWSNSSPRLFLKTANPHDRTSPIQGSGWITSQHAALLNEASVPPGSNGTFTFNVNTDGYGPKIFLEGFRLVAEGVTEFGGYYMARISTPTYKWSLQSLSYSSGTALMAPGTTQEVTAVVRNTGTATWFNSGTNPMRLGTWPSGRGSPFSHDSWLSPSRMTTLQEASVPPGADGTFVFTVRAPQQTGEYGERFNLVSENRQWANDIGAQAYFHVVNPYQWQPVSLGHSTGTAVMEPGEEQTITIVAKNTGTVTWERDGTFPVRLGTWGPNRTSHVSHGSWLSPIRPAGLQEATVPPDSNGTFTFTVRAPFGGEFFERVNLVAEGNTWFNDPGLQFYLNVKGYYAWQFVELGHSTGTAVNQAGSSLTLTLKARNIGNTTWHNAGDFPVRLGTTQPQDRGSAIYHSSWLRDFRPTTLQESSVPPGGIGTFTFQARVPGPGEYSERFSLVAENLTWLNDPGTYFYIKSVP